jgi:hypothetical protein
MKTTFFFFIAFTTSSFSQTYYPTFKTSDTYWKYYFLNSMPYKQGIDTIKNTGDTTINGKTYKKLNGFTKPIFVREDTSLKSIFEYVPFLNSESILYDYRLGKGDQITLKWFEVNCFLTDIVFLVDTTYFVNINAGTRKVIKLHPKSGYSRDLTWLESVGAMRFDSIDISFLHFKYNGVCPGWPDVGGRKLICKSDNSSIVFEKSFYINKYSYDCDGKHDSCYKINSKKVVLTNNILISQDTLCTYQWLNCNNSFSNITGQTNKTYSPSDTGSYAVKISKNGCIDTSNCIYVDLCQNAINKNVILVNKVLYSQDTLCTYQWLNCNNNYSNIAGQTNKSYTPSASGSYAVKISKNGCTDTSNCIDVNPCQNVINKNIISVNNVLHSQDTLCTYQWLNCNNNYSTIAGQTNKSYTPSASGSYAVKISKNGCMDTSICINVNPCENAINKNVISVNKVLYSQDTLCSYQWLNCNNNFSNITGQTNKSFAPSTSGRYAVRITKNGCVDSSNCFNIVKLSINNNIQDKITIYPNPANNYIEITNCPKEATIKIYSALGQQVEYIKLSESKINISNFYNGTYLLIIQDKNDVVIYKQTLIK